MNHRLEYHDEDKSSSVRNQYIAAIVVCLGFFCCGCGIGWVSPSLKHLRGSDSGYGEALTPKQIGSVASLYCVGGLLGTLIFGWIAERIGRWRTGLLIAVPYVISWVMKLVVPDYKVLLAARFLNGFGGGGSYFLAPLYCLEIGSVRVRGSLGSIAPLAMNAGILFAYFIGYVLSYKAALWIHLCVPVVYFIGFYFMPETPSMLVKMNKITDAAKSIAWLRNTNVDDKNVKDVLSNVMMENELANMTKHGKNHAVEDEPTHEVTVNGETRPTNSENVSTWKLLVKSKATLKAFAVGFVLVMVNGYVGVFAIINFASEIFAEANSSLSPDVCAIILSILQLVGSYISIILIERLGRKSLFTISSTIFGLCEFILGTYFYLKVSNYDLSSFGWIPILALSTGIFIDALGVGPVPLVIINEIFMIQVRELAVSILVSMIWVSEFTQTEFFAPAVSLIGISGVFWLFGTVAIFGGAFCFICVPETKGKSLDEILRYFDKDLPSHVHL